jgi:ectoine hydroxylase-related dioxygenase (phytanoyl-CoA dioxygenase family)
MRYVRGSHRWPSFFKPNAFAGRTSLDQLGLAADDEDQVPLPDIEGNPEGYDIVTHPSEPGDVIVHHSRLVHGSGPYYTSDVRRRAVWLRFAGDDVTWWFHRSAPPQPHHVHALCDGDPVDCDQFPVVWRAGA